MDVFYEKKVLLIRQIDFSVSFFFFTNFNYKSGHPKVGLEGCGRRRRFWVQEVIGGEDGLEVLWTVSRWSFLD